MIAADGDETVGELHDKTGCTEADDTFRERNAGGKFSADKICDNTVAAAAPFTPRWKVKIKSGSRRMFAIAPIATENIPVVE